MMMQNQQDLHKQNGYFVVYASDSEIENDHKVYYHDFGCTHPRELIATKYNRLMFKYFDSDIGKEMAENC
jgi:hypothetical protein